VTYTLTVKDVRDCSNPPVAVAADTKKAFTFVKGLFGAAPRDESAPGARRPPMPKFKLPVMFNAPEADPILAALQVFPKNSAWNEDISKSKVHPDSDKIVASVGGDKNLQINFDMAFILVPRDQPRIDVKIAGFAGESDKGPFPVPDNAPIEGWPMDGKTLEAAQRAGGADRHMLVVDPAGGMVYEFYQAFKRPGGWEVSGEATFDLKTNHMRPRGWTSSDAAGLPIFPSLPRFDECDRGLIDHALRFTVRQTRREFLYPARHHAGRSDSPAVPAMGQRFRLKASTDLSGFSRHALAIATALKRHGMFVADNGSDWSISVPPDKRLTGLESLRKLRGSDFEVVVTTGETDLGRPN
ncbi:MAG TPA: hypothetical protein VJB14_12855, partial [Planctomycetota bacterium]|nr:hypothetical protein [Planctomycetota bacterium]